MPLRLRNCAGLVIAACLCAGARGTVVYETGFEQPEFLPGALVGQQGWATTASQFSAGAAQIVGTTVRTGVQALQIDALTIPSADWFFKPLDFTPAPAEPVVVVGLDLYLASSALESQGWGVDAYDLSGVRIGQFYISPNGLASISDGNSTAPAALAAHDLWNHYDFTLDFSQRRFWLSVNGAPPLAAMAFNPLAGAGFGDADFRVFGAGTDSAYFDNYRVQSIPAPTQSAWAAVLVGWTSLRRRRAASQR